MYIKVNFQDIKDELIKAGRYDNVMTELSRIIDKAEKGGNFPVDLYKTEDGNMSRSILMKDIVPEVKVFYENLSDGNIYETDDPHPFSNFIMYIHSRNNALLHNIGVAVTHRKSTSERDLETARVLSCLENLLACNFQAWEEDYKWTVPEGWYSNSKYYDHMANNY